jgi:hypothetical protein
MSASRHAVYLVRHAQALAGIKCPGQRHHIGCGRAAGQQVERDCTQRKDIQLRPDALAAGQQFGGKVSQCGIVDQLLRMDRRTGFHPVLRVVGADAAVSRLPVQDYQARLRRIRCADQDARRAQRAVIDPLAMGMAQRLSKLAHHVQLLDEAQRAALLSQVVVEANRCRIVVEDKRRAALAVLEVAHP